MIGKLLTVIDLVLYIFVLLLVLRRWRRNPAIRRFFFVLLLTFFWILNSFLEGELQQYYHFLAHSNFAIASLIAGCLAVFALHYPNAEQKLTKKKEAFLWLPIVALFILSFTTIFVRPTTFQKVEPSPFYIVYFVIIVLYFLGIGATVLIRKLFRSEGIQRQQLRGFLVGYLVSILILLSESVYVNGFKEVSIAKDQLILNAAILFAGTGAYSILRYRFLDLRVTIQRGAIRVLTFLIVFGLYLLSILLIHQSIHPQTRDGDVMFLVIVTLVVVLTVEPIRKFIFRKVDSLFDSHEDEQRRMRERIKLAATTQQTHEALMATALDFVRETSGFKDVSFVESRDDFFHGKIATRSYLERYGRILVVGELPYRLEENEAFRDIAQELKDSGVGLLLPIGKGELFMGCFIIRSQQNSIFPSQTIQALKDLQFQISDAIIGARLYKQAVERIRV